MKNIDRRVLIITSFIPLLLVLFGQYKENAELQENYQGVLDNAIFSDGYELIKLKTIECSLRIGEDSNREKFDEFVKKSHKQVNFHLNSKYVKEDLKKQLESMLELSSKTCDELSI